MPKRMVVLHEALFMCLEKATRFEYSVPLCRDGLVWLLVLSSLLDRISDWVACIAWDACRRGGREGL